MPTFTLIPTPPTRWGSGLSPRLLELDFRIVGAQTRLAGPAGRGKGFQGGARMGAYDRGGASLWNLVGRGGVARVC